MTAPSQPNDELDKNRCEVCGEVATTKRNRIFLCTKHARVMAWIKDSKWRGVKVPNWFQMEQLIPQDMRCPACRCVMTWTRKEGASRIITIQHNRDGSIGILCFDCNIKHRGFNGDEFYEHCGTAKRCPDCNTVKSFDEFPKSKSKSNGIGAYCKECAKGRTGLAYKRSLNAA